MLLQAHAAGLRMIVDLMPNHTSDEHPWFRAAARSRPGSPERARYIFRDGRGADHERPPNNWTSVFSGRAWSRAPGDQQWYLHLFDRRQPDLNWEHPEVRAELEDVLRFWLDRGVDGFRVDVAHGLIKAPGLPDWEGRATMVQGNETPGINQGPMWDQVGVHEIYRSWRRVLEEYENGLLPEGLRRFTGTPCEVRMLPLPAPNRVFGSPSNWINRVCDVTRTMLPELPAARLRVSRPTAIQIACSPQFLAYPVRHSVPS